MKHICILILLLIPTVGLSQVAGERNYYEALQQCRVDRNRFSDKAYNIIQEFWIQGERLSECVNTLQDYQHLLGRALLVIELDEKRIRRLRRRLKKASG